MAFDSSLLLASDAEKQLKLSNHDEIHAASACRYAEAVELYASTSLSAKDIARRCKVSVNGLRSHLAHYHRDLMFARYGMSDLCDYNIRLRSKRGQSLPAREKFGAAMEACSDVTLIEFSISQIAVMHRLEPSALANQLRAHCPDLIVMRKKMRQRLGFARNTQHGVKKDCMKYYADAVEMYRDTTMTLREIADACHVSLGGLGQHLRYYHRDLVAMRAALREHSKSVVKRGHMSGNGSVRGPKASSVAKYSDAVDMAADLSLDIGEIARITGIDESSFRCYLSRWHRDVLLKRRGLSHDDDLNLSTRRNASTMAKYAPAVASLQKCLRPVAHVAVEYGLNADNFRRYLKMHYPHLCGCGRQR